MFWTMVLRALIRQKGRMLMIAFTVALGTSLATAMLNVMMDVGDKVNQELKAYGANIVVEPKQVSVMNELYETDSSLAYLNESDIPKIKTIFWSFNIVDFAPFMKGLAEMGERRVPVRGTWFDRTITLPTGQSFVSSMKNLKSWWTMDGQFPSDEDDEAAVIGTALAQEQNLRIGDNLCLEGSAARKCFIVSGVFGSGSDDDGAVFVTLNAAQQLFGAPGKISSMEVSALTTPDNELSRKAARNPNALSLKEMETWYCTAYVSSICYQIDEVISGAVAKPVRQVAESEGAILEKTQLLMTLITLLSLVGSALGISNLVTTTVMERSREIALLKALGAFNQPIVLLLLTEIYITALIGGCAGYFCGIGFAQIIGHSVFSSAIEIKTLVIPIVTVLVAAVTMIGSFPAIRLLLSLRPATVLHGGSI